MPSNAHVGRGERLCLIANVMHPPGLQVRWGAATQANCVSLGWQHSIKRWGVSRSRPRGGLHLKRGHMSTTFKKSGVNFAKESDAACQPGLRDRVRNLEYRLFEVAFERDQLAAVVTSKREAIDRLTERRDLLEVDLCLLKEAVRQQMRLLVKVGEIDRETANLMLENLGLRTFRRKYRVSFEVAVDGFEGGSELHAEDVRELLERVAGGEGSLLSEAELGALAVESAGIF